MGSRGGHGHRHSDDPAFWSARCQRWRAAHPEYRQREAERPARRRAQQAEQRAEVRFTEVIRSLMRRLPYRAMGRVLAVDHVTVWRVIREPRPPNGETIDAVVAAFGPSEVLREWRRLRRERRAMLDAGRAASTPLDSPAGIPQERAARP